MTKLMKNYQIFTFWWFKSLYPALTNTSVINLEAIAPCTVGHVISLVHNVVYHIGGTQCVIS